MPAVRDILVHVKIEVAQRVRICHRKRRGCGVAKNQQCLAIYKADGGRKNYCPPHALEILAAARAKLAAMEKALQS
jgi:hypothetical protein